MDRTCKKSQRKISFNLFETKYEVIPHVIKNLVSGVISQDCNDDTWDVLWTDSAITPDRLSRMKHYQKINHFPGMYSISRKNYLAYNLNKQKKQFPSDYNFFPRTWVVPSDLGEIKNFLLLNRNSYLIVKPEASCQGKGIFLTRKFEDIDNGGKFVVQEYLNKPYLIDSLKFDLRIYVLVTGCSPLRLFVHKEGLARFATEKYIKPNTNNCWNMCMHLTNYAINKSNPKFVYNNDEKKDNVGHKRSLKSTFEYMEKQGVDTDELWNKIEDIIIKTLCSVQPILSHHYKSCQPDDFSNSMCFEILGFDIILDSNLTPYVLEVNHTPSFSTDSPLDFSVKQTVIFDTLRLINLDRNLRKEYKKKQKIDVLRRNLTGKVEKISKEERKILADMFVEKRNLWELENCFGFKKIYPLGDFFKYEKFIQAADNYWQEWTGTNISRNSFNRERLSKSFSLIPKQKIKQENIECSEALKRLAKPKINSQHSNFPYIIYRSNQTTVSKSRSNLSCVNLFEKTIETDTKKAKKLKIEDLSRPVIKQDMKILKPIEKRTKKISLKEILSLDCLDIKVVKFKSQTRMTIEKL